jgi:glycosyltransferase involved in cell wall biosynthesis
VVTATPTASPWSEEAVIVRRVAGALACTAEVDLLVAGGRPVPGEREAAVHVVRFASEEVPRQHRDAYLRAAFGLADFQQPPVCACAETLMRDLAAQVPLVLQRRLADLACPSPEGLREHLRRERYDVVVVAGYAAAPLIEDAPCGRLVLVPLAREEPSLHLEVYDPVFDQAAVIVVFTEWEGSVVRRRLRRDLDSRVRNVGFVIRTNSAPTPAGARSEGPFLLVARDWGEPFPMAWLARVAARLNRRFPRLEICLTGPAVENVGREGPFVLRTVRSRLDLERSMSRAFAVLDPEPRRLFGRDVVEALLLGTPVIVPACGGATRAHAETGNGGLWYRSEAELEECVAVLGDPDLRATLGRQGHAYSEKRFGDPQAFTNRLTEAVTEPG